MVCTHSDQNFMRGTRIEGQLVCESVGKPHSVADARESYRGGWSCGAVVKQEHSASPGPRLRTMRRQVKWERDSLIIRSPSALLTSTSYKPSVLAGKREIKEGVEGILNTEG